MKHEVKQTQRQKSPIRPYSARVFGGVSAVQRLLEILQQTTVLMLAVLGFLFCLTSSYQLDIYVVRAVWTAVFFIALFSISFSTKHGGWILLIFFIPAVYLFWKNAETLTQGILLLVDHAVELFNLTLPDALQSMLQPHTAREATVMMTAGVQAILFFCRARFLLFRDRAPKRIRACVRNTAAFDSGFVFSRLRRTFFRSSACLAHT